MKRNKKIFYHSIITFRTDSQIRINSLSVDAKLSKFLFGTTIETNKTYY